jgi:hypothetical protein
MPEEGKLDRYTDSLRFTVGPYGVNFSFGLAAAHPERTRPAQAEEFLTLRMSLENAKVMAMLLRRNLKQYERENGLEIALPAGVYTELGIAREDWGFEEKLG